MGHDDPLALDAETMRRLGYRTVDMLVDLLAGTRDAPVLRTASRDEMEALLDEPPPEEPTSFEVLLDGLVRNVLPYVGRFDHPRFFAYIPGSGTWPAALGDLVASAVNIDAGEWREAAGPSQLELTVLDWFKEWIGYPPEAAGVLLSGGSASNLQGVAVAREALLGPMSDQALLYVGDTAHSSIARGVRALGFRPDQVRILPTDASHRLGAATVRAAMDADVSRGGRPLVLVAAAGATSTGAVDALPELAALCRDLGVWLHVDAAYGGFAALTERGRRALAGIEEADSVTLDPHKWLYMPFEVGSLLVRRGDLLRSAFEITPEYLKDAQLFEREVNFANRGLQLTRAARSLKVWLALKYFGVDAFRRAIDRSLDLAAAAEERVRADDRLELVTPASLGVLTFRRRFPGVTDESELERRNAEVLQALAASGEGLLSSTRLHGRYVIRFCVMNHTSSAGDVDRVLDWVARAELSAQPLAAVPVRATEAGILRGWLARPRLDVDGLKALPLFRGLSVEQAAGVLAASREETVMPGQGVVDQWDSAKTFYIVLDGAVAVKSEERHLRDLGPGDFFGEFAALDWGAGYSYARTASVVASMPTRLLAVPGAVLDELYRTVPDVEGQIQAAMRERAAPG